MNEQKQPKVIIVGAHGERAAIGAFINSIDRDKLGAIIIDVDTKMCDGFVPISHPIVIEPLPMIELPSYPETRAERRAKARKKKTKRRTPITLIKCTSKAIKYTRCHAQ